MTTAEDPVREGFDPNAPAPARRRSRWRLVVAFVVAFVVAIAVTAVVASRWSTDQTTATRSTIDGETEALTIVLLSDAMAEADGLVAELYDVVLTPNNSSRSSSTYRAR